MKKTKIIFILCYPWLFVFAVLLIPHYLILLAPLSFLWGWNAYYVYKLINKLK